MQELTMQRSRRSRLSLQGEFVLALLPTVIVLAVFALVEVLSKQRLLFGIARLQCVPDLP